MLGSAVLPALVKAGDLVWGTDIIRGWDYVDVRDIDQVREAVAGFGPDLIVHLAAETNLEVCEADPEHARSTNIIGTENVARAAASSRARVVYISTAGIFDGHQNEPYDESDHPNPINEYGSSKLAGENIVAETCELSVIVRAGWMMGGGCLDHKFVGKILSQLRAGADTVFAVDDKFGSPTYAPDFAQCLLGLLARDMPGLFHMASGGKPSRFDVAAHILRVLGKSDKVQLVPVSSQHFQDEYPVARPRSEALTNAALQRHGLNTMRPWKDALEAYLLRDFAALLTGTTQQLPGGPALRPHPQGQRTTGYARPGRRPSGRKS